VRLSIGAAAVVVMAVLVGCSSDDSRLTADEGLTARIADFRRATEGILTAGPPLSDEDVVRSAESFCLVAYSATDVETFVSAVVRLSDGFYLEDVGLAVDASLRVWCPSEFQRLLSDGRFGRLLDENKSAIELGAEARASGPARTPTELDRQRLDLMREALRDSDYPDLVLMADAIAVEDLILGSEIYCPILYEAGSLDAFTSELEVSYRNDPGSALMPFAALEEFVGHLVFLFCP
jgi:hypothetical protein